MLKGYTLPRTPHGTSSLAPAPPWHYVGNALAVEFETDRAAATAFLPPPLELASGQCAAYFVEWQYASDEGEEFLDPIRSQYRETIILLSASYEGVPVAYCPFIWVDQDVSLMRGLVQGWPKQFGSTWVTKGLRPPVEGCPRSRSWGQVWRHARRSGSPPGGGPGDPARNDGEPALSRVCPGSQHTLLPGVNGREA